MRHGKTNLGPGPKELQTKDRVDEDDDEPDELQITPT
jgi:hypothetical protein